MRPIVIAAALPMVLPLAAAGQNAGSAPPDGWMIRTDHAEQSPAEIAFMDMPPGWHVTTGPAAIFWHPERSASGTFRVEMEAYLFDPRERREGFGIFVGGADLDGPGQRYVYFLLREGGEFLVKRRAGEETEVLVDWSPAPSMLTFAARADDQETARNVMSLDADAEELRFLVNGEEVASLPRAEVEVDGVVGMRVNHGLNLHVSRLDVESGSGGGR